MIAVVTSPLTANVMTGRSGSLVLIVPVLRIAPSPLAFHSMLTFMDWPGGSSVFSISNLVHLHEVPAFVRVNRGRRRW